MTQSKAMEAAARAMSKALDRDNDRFDNPRNYERDSYMQEARAAISAYLKALADDGWKLVPVEATEAMLEFAFGSINYTEPEPSVHAERVYSAMLAAAPSAIEEQKP